MQSSSRWSASADAKRSTGSRDATSARRSSVRRAIVPPPNVSSGRARRGRTGASASRARALHVLLVLDSLARVAAALREIAVALGESTGRGGYPPSVFAELARLVEVAGALARGSITLIATVLSDGDDRDPVSEAARSLLDGHIALSTVLAQAGRFPAVDVLASTSRTMEMVADGAHLRAARAVRGAIAALERVKDARSLGIESEEPAVRAAVAAEDRFEDFLRQGARCSDPETTLARLGALAGLVEAQGADR